MGSSVSNICNGLPYLWKALPPLESLNADSYDSSLTRPSMQSGIYVLNMAILLKGLAGALLDSRGSTGLIKF